MRTRQIALAALAVTTAGAAALGIAAVAGAEDGVAPATAAPAVRARPETPVTPVPPVPPVSTAAPATTTTAAPALPVPEDAPADPRADVPVVEIGRVAVPAIGLDHAVYEGVWLTVIDRGPGHWPGTALPGGFGNAVFGGHRVTHSHPFRDLDRLRAGDEITFTMRDGARHTYAVTDQFVVSPEDVWIVDQQPGRTLTLFACHPKGSARQRIVIRAELLRP